MPYDWPDAIDLILAERSLKDADKVAILGGNLASSVAGSDLVQIRL